MTVAHIFALAGGSKKKASTVAEAIVDKEV
jgi:hypothetical protein